MYKAYGKDCPFKMYQPFLDDGVFDYFQICTNTHYQAVFYQFNTPCSYTGTVRVPDGCIDIWFVEGAGESVMAFIGSPTQAQSVHGFAGAYCFGVRLMPGVYVSYQDIPIKNIVGNKYVFSAANGALRNFFVRLSGCVSFEQRIALFCHFFEPHVSGGIARRVLCEINGSGGSLPIQQLADSMNYSERHISRIFQENLGFSPKTFARVVRFQNALDIMIHSAGHRIGDRFIDLGYSDQAHFQREFKQFSGMTPKNFSNYLSRKM